MTTKEIGEVVDKVLEESDLKRQLEAEKQKRSQACLDEIQALLLKYNCDIIPIVQIAGSRINTSISITAK